MPETRTSRIPLHLFASDGLSQMCALRDGSATQCMLLSAHAYDGADVLNKKDGGNHNGDEVGGEHGGDSD